MRTWPVKPYRDMTYRDVYFIGIGGIGMSALARYCNFKGFKVSGYDRTPSDLTRELEKEGIAIHYEDSVSAIPENPASTLVIYTPAIPHDMQELKYVSTFLEKFGLDAHKVEEVAPYRKELQEYTARGYDIDRNNAATTLASMTVWNLYNSVTAFASHNDIWPEEDGRRMAVCETAVKFLYHDRDIKNYIDIFA